MSLRTLRVLTVTLFVAVLALFAYFRLTRDEWSAQELAERAAFLLPRLRPGAVSRLTLESEAGGNVVLVKPEGDGRLDGFHLDSLDGPLADDARTVKLLEALEYTKAEPTERLAPKASASLRATLTDGQGETELSFFAAASPSDAELVMRREPDGSSRAFLVSQALREALQLRRTDFLPRALFPVARKNTARLEIQRGAEHLILLARGGTFYVGEGRVDRDYLEKLFLEMARAELEPVVDKATAELLLREGPGAEGLRVVQFDLEGTAHAVRFGAACPDRPGLVAAIRQAPSELAGCVSESLLLPFRKGQAEILDAHLTPLRADEIDHVVLVNGQGTFDLLRSEEHFELRTVQSPGGSTERLEGGRGQELLRLLATSRVEPLREALEKPFESRGSLRIVGHTASDAVLDETLPYGLAPSGAWIARQTDGTFVVLDERVEHLLEHPELSFRSGRLFPTRLDLTALEQRSRFGRFRLVRRGEGWAFESDAARGTAAPAVETSSLEKLLSSLTELEVERFVASRPAAAQRAAPPREEALLHLSLELQGTQPRQELKVWERTSSGFRATLMPAALEFVLNPDQVAQLSEVPLSRAGARLDPAPQQVELRLALPYAEERVVSMVRKGEALHYTQKKPRSPVTPPSNGAEASADFQEPTLSAEELWELVLELAPGQARPDLARQLERAHPVLTVSSDGPENPRKLRYFDNPRAHSYDAPSLVVVGADGTPFSLDGTRLRPIAEALNAWGEP